MDLKKLPVGESLAISIGCKGDNGSGRHDMLMYVKRESNDKFKVVHHNQGEGITNYHYRKTDSNGKTFYQTAFEISNVAENDLANFIDHLPSFYNNSVSDIYKNKIPLLKGNINLPSDDTRLWSHGQIGGSCFASCARSLIRSELQTNSYKELRDKGRTDIVLKFYKQIKNGNGTTAKKTIVLESIEKLKLSLKKRGMELPKEFEEVVRQLEEENKNRIAADDPSNMIKILSSPSSKKSIKLNSITVNKPVDHNGVPTFKPAENINICFAILKNRNFDAESIKTVEPYTRQL